MKLTSILSILTISVTVFVFSPTCHAQAVDEEPVLPIAAWLFDEGQGNVARDVTGNGFDGQIIDNVKWKGGRLGGALEFGPGRPWGRVVIPHQDGLALSRFTMTARVRIRRSRPPLQMIIGKEQNRERISYSMWIEPDGQLMVGTYSIFPVLGGTRTNHTDKIADDLWHFVAGVYDRKMLVAYIDGNPLGAVKWIGKPLVGDEGALPKMDIAPLMIGATSPDGVSGMEGLIDDVGLFDVALNQSQLQTIMEEGLLKYLAINPRGKLATTWGHIRSN